MVLSVTKLREFCLFWLCYVCDCDVYSFHILNKIMASQSVALASLTATYTDSEDEGVEHDERSDFSDKDRDSYTPKSSPKVTPIFDQQPVPRNSYAKLVSYNDDLVLSEDEENEDNEGNKPEESTIDENDVQLPPEPVGRCSNELLEKISRLHDKMLSSGLDMNFEIQQRKEFRNPSIYEKLIQYCSINEFGTNFPPAIYDPLSWGKESFYEELDKAQRAEMSRREKERKEKQPTKVEFVIGMAKRGGTSSNPGSGTEDDSKRRKSKWDQVGNNLTALQTVRPATLLQQSALTTTITGTKSTVISAFGSLPKKPRV